jgi:hypothetical protein
MKNKHQSRKRRQLSRLIEALKYRMEYSNESTGVIHRIKLKIKFLLQDLSGFVSKHQLKRILGSFALVFGFAASFHAQDFAAPVQNPFGLVTPEVYLQFPEMVDFDNDGDLDILTGADYGVYYYENTGSAKAPIFAAPQQDPFGLSNPSTFVTPAVTDLDNDGDLDVLIGDNYGVLNYFENTGTASAPAFEAPVANPFGLSSTYEYALPEFADLDNDGDLDLMVGDYNGNFQYFENTGTASIPAFTAPVQNPFGMIATGSYISMPELADFDNDGDLDLLIGVLGNFEYYLNTGDVANPVFDGPTTNPFGLTQTYDVAYPVAADLDNDGDFDLLVGEFYGTFQYFENVDPTTSIVEITVDGSISPNPVLNLAHFDFDVEVSHVEFLNLAGQVVLMIENPGKNTDLSSLDPGVYLIKCTHLNDQKSTHKLQKL